jgi:hypothetical protein
MEELCSSKKLVTIYKTTRCHNPENQNAIYHCRENFIHFTRLLENLITLKHVEEKHVVVETVSCVLHTREHCVTFAELEKEQITGS